MRNGYNKPPVGYRLLWHYVQIVFGLNYHKITYSGRENIPTEGALIFCSNHQSALMDALVILFLRHHYPLFVARADIFKKPLIKKALNFLRILPLNRIRDGIGSLQHNDETNTQVVEVLSQRVPFVILPEGNHRPMKSLQPLLKGVFRIALQTIAHTQGKLPVYIVPVGIDYSGYYHWGESVLAQVGQPINVTALNAEMQGFTDAEKINHLKETLALHLQEVMIHIADVEQYDALLLQCEQKAKGTPLQKFKSTKKNLRKWASLMQANGEKGTKILDQTAHFVAQSRAAQIDPVSLRGGNLWQRVLCSIFVLIISLPYSLPSLLLNLPLWGISAWLCRLFADRSFHNSVRMVVTIFVPLILYPIYIVAAAFLLPSCISLLLFTLLLLPSWAVSGYFMRSVRLTVSHIRLMILQQKLK